MALSVNQRAVFASKQRELLPTVLMPSSISSGCAIFPWCLFLKIGKLSTLIYTRRVPRQYDARKIELSTEGHGCKR